MDFYIKTDFSFLIYGSEDLKWVFGSLKTDLAFLFIGYLVWGIRSGRSFNVPPILNWDSVRHIIYYL